MSSYTPTQQRILDLLSDGQPHPREELLECIDDELSNPHNLPNHLCLLRKRLPADHDIICQLLRNKIHYRHVRLLTCTY